MSHKIAIAFIPLCALAVVALGGEAAKLQKTEDGGISVTAETYQVHIGPTGCLESVRAGDTEFLRTDSVIARGSGVIDYIQPGRYGLLHEEMTFEELGEPATQGSTVTATGPKTTLTYHFRATDFDVVPKGKERNGFYLLLPSENVLRSLDVETDKPVLIPDDAPVWWSQEGMRWFTRQGPVLMMTERVDGYTSCSWWSHEWLNKRNYPAPGVSLRITQSPAKYTFRLLPKPTAVEAVSFAIACAHSDFFLPDGGPVRFDIQATNSTHIRQKTRVDFEVRHYCTREVVGRTSTTIELTPGASQSVSAQVDVAEPGPYRGVVAVKEGEKTLREIGWVFVYDFTNYKPDTTRQPDFKTFWTETLDELARVPWIRNSV